MEKSSLITYDTLYEILRKEKTNLELQKLDNNIFNDIINYIKEKNKILQSQKQKDSIFTKLEIEKTKRQIQNIKKMLKELYEKREAKIINLALLYSRTKPEKKELPLLKEEKVLYNELIKTLNYFRENILERLKSGDLPKIEKPKEIKINHKEQKTKLLRILTEIPKFYGNNLEIYGPFEKEDIANLPTNIANILIKNKRAEEIK